MMHNEVRCPCSVPIVYTSWDSGKALFACLLLKSRFISLITSLYELRSLAPGVGLEPTSYSRGVYQFHSRPVPTSRSLISFAGSSDTETYSFAREYSVVYLSLPRRLDIVYVNKLDLPYLPRPIVMSPKFASSILPFSNVRVSSGEEAKLFFCILAIYSEY